MLTRRRFIISSAMLGAGLVVPKIRANASTSSSSLHKRNRNRVSAASGIGLQSVVVGGTLDPLTITKYFDPLVVPPAMPKVNVITGKNGEEIDYYEIAVRQFEQQILPANSFGKTTVWSYGSAGITAEHANTNNYPAFTIEGQVNRPIRVKWINELKVKGLNEEYQFLPHLLPIDQNLHWANPGGGVDMRDHKVEPPTATPYTGPVPIVTHVHGAHTHEESDGFSEAWFLPDTADIPANFARVGSRYDEFKQKSEARLGQTWDPGSSIFEYPNDQRAGTNWYHDHAIGMTRNNVYAGPAGFFILRGGSDDMQDGSLPAGNYEVPIAVQDRSFDQTTVGGQVIPSLFYPTSREFFDGALGSYIPDKGSDIPPIWNPEFFGNIMVVNGKSWPQFTVERRRYRVRFLNGCNSRFVILRMVSDDLTTIDLNTYVYPVEGALPFWQIGAEGGFLDQPAKVDKLLMSPAERADVIIDFSKVPNTINSIYLINEGPDSPFGGGTPGIDFERSDLATTGQVMRFDLVDATSTDTSTDPASLTLPARQKLGDTNKIRRVALLEMGSATLPNAGPREAVLGVVGKNIFGYPTFTEKAWHEPITETPLAGDTEIWEIFNTTEDAHPIHVHQVMFEVVNREDRLSGQIFSPEATELGFKDTVIAYPGQITRIKAKFDLPGLYVWHCHIVEHEDNEMMRPYQVLNRINMPFISNK